MIRQPLATIVASGKDPNHFPHNGTALVVRLLADRVNWLAVVDALLPWDAARSRIAPSVVLLTLIMNGLTQRSPLYSVESWAATLPLALLWGDAIQPSQFNDDAFGRVLEGLADHGLKLLGYVGAVLSRAVFRYHRLCIDRDYPSATTGPTAPVDLTWVLALIGFVITSANSRAIGYPTA